MKTQSINGAANTATINTYDTLSRITQFTNPLGVFTQTYDPVNLMPKTLTAPNGLTTTLDYHPAAADLRLKEIKHTRPGNVALSKHVYGYKPAGNISSWAQTLGTSAAKTWAIAYDKADQLEAATQTQGATVTAQQAFRFDRIGNITSKQDGSEISKGTFNNRNQLTAQEPGGWMRVRGTTNEGASVKVKSNANPFTNAATTSADGFSAWVQASPGANTVTVEAKDDSPNANTRTQSWSVNVTGQSRVPTYDLNGNMTANGLGQTYLWDAENRLVKITYADNSKTEFTYDGLSRRVRITERNAGNTITGDKRYLWAGGNQPAEEREANGTTVTKRYFPQGEQRIGGADAGFYYYTKDHLGSVREITNSSGALATRYDFDLWEKRTKLSGTLETEVGFTGHHHHSKSGLVLTWFRAYDADAGRWLSPDPLGEMGGINLYAYVEGNPINTYDLLGLCGATMSITRGMLMTAAGISQLDSPVPGPADAVALVTVIAAGVVGSFEYYGAFDHINRPSSAPTYRVAQEAYSMEDFYSPHKKIKGNQLKQSMKKGMQGEIQIKERAKRKEREIEVKIAQQTGRGDYVTSKNIQGSY